MDDSCYILIKEWFYAMKCDHLCTHSVDLMQSKSFIGWKQWKQSQFTSRHKHVEKNKEQKRQRKAKCVVYVA